MSSMEMEEMVRREIQKYSVVVGIVLVIVFVVPCITLALVAKCFQKQTAGGRKVGVYICLCVCLHSGVCMSVCLFTLCC